MNEPDLDKVNVSSIWLLLLAEGGLWKVGEICDELAFFDSNVMCKYVHMMSKRGYLRRHRQEGEQNRYSVDRACKIPMGMALSDLIDARALA